MVYSEVSYTRQKQHLHATPTFSFQCYTHGNATLMAPFKLRAEMPMESVSSILWDSGASRSITNDKTDFHGTLKPCPYKHLKVKGVAQAIKVHGQGTVLWHVLDEAGILRTLKVPVLYIPDVKIKLFSVNSSEEAYPEETVIFHPQGATMSGVPGEPSQRQINNFIHL